MNADNLNRSSLGGVWVGPLDASAYAMALYMNGSFGTGAKMVDYAQWNIAGASNATAAERADEAVSAGVWQEIATGDRQTHRENKRIPVVSRPPLYCYWRPGAR